jgi:hypothetical protein
MSSHAGLGDLVEQIRATSRDIAQADTRNSKRLDSIEQSVNELYKRSGRPGAEICDDGDERKSAIGLCQIHKSLVAEGDATVADYTPGSTEIQTATLARKGLKARQRKWATEARLPAHCRLHGLKKGLGICLVGAHCILLDGN